MASSYVNDLRLNEMATGDASGSWGTNTNVNLELIGEGLGYGTEAITTNANTHASVVADGATDPVRAMYVEYTGTLDSACTITISPNTINRMHFIENGTSGSQNIIIKQGSGATITIPPGDTKAVYLDGAGSGAKVVDAFVSLNVGALTGASLDISGNIDVDGTTNLDNTDIDGTLDVSGQVTFADGSAGAPSISNTGDVNAGLFFSAADVMSFSAGGTAQFTMADGSISPVTDNDIDLGTASLKYKSFFAGLVDAENFKINGGQGSDGQVLTSTGSGVAFEDAGGGPTFKVFGTSSIMVGDDATGTINAANLNTALGVDVFAALTSGDNNTAVGFKALTGNTTGAGNTGIGKGAGYRITTGNDNLFVGHSDDSNAGATTGSSNTMIGRSAGERTTSGNSNTFVGALCGDLHTTSNTNTGVGASALTALTTGANNTSVGASSLAANTTGASNTAMGNNAMAANTTGQGEAFGLGALTAQTTGSENQAFGLSALTACTTGTSNVAVGKGAFQALTTGSDSVAIGRGAGDAVTTAANNTFVGSASGGATTTGATNTAIGAVSGAAITTGVENTCVGASTAEGLTTGGNNVCIGLGAGNANNPGGNLQTQSNRIVIGNASSANAHIQIDWTVASDKRDKTDVTPLDMGLGFINKLEPVTYKWDKRAKYEEGNTPDGTHKEDWLDVGFLAQDVEELEAEFGHKIDDETNLTTYMSEDTDSYGLTYAKFIPMLVKSIQELSTQVETLKTEVATLKGE